MANIGTLPPERIADSLSGSAEIEFTAQSRAGKHSWVQATLAEQQYLSLGKKQRGTVRVLLRKVAGLSLP